VLGHDQHLLAVAVARAWKRRATSRISSRLLALVLDDGTSAAGSEHVGGIGSYG